MKKTKFIIPAIVLGTVAVVGISGMNYASASSTETNPQSSIIAKIAEKFNLNQDEVKKIFDEERDEREAEMKQKRKKRLAKLVSEGKLTESQKEAFIIKEAEMQKNREEEMSSLKDLSQEERRKKAEEYRKAHQEEMKKFFEEQGIDESLFAPLGGQGDGMRKGGGNGLGNGQTENSN